MQRKNRKILGTVKPNTSIGSQVYNFISIIMLISLFSWKFWYVILYIYVYDICLNPDHWLKLENSLTNLIDTIKYPSRHPNFRSVATGHSHGARAPSTFCRRAGCWRGRSAAAARYWNNCFFNGTPQAVQMTFEMEVVFLLRRYEKIVVDEMFGDRHKLV